MIFFVECTMNLIVWRAKPGKSCVENRDFSLYNESIRVFQGQANSCLISKLSFLTEEHQAVSFFIFFRKISLTGSTVSSFLFWCFRLSNMMKTIDLVPIILVQVLSLPGVFHKNVWCAFGQLQLLTFANEQILFRINV